VTDYSPFVYNSFIGFLTASLRAEFVPWDQNLITGREWGERVST